MLEKAFKEVSLYEPIGTDKEGNEINLLDVIESAPVDIVEDCYIRENTDYLLRSLKKVLSDKEYQVICCRYGLFGMEEETQREIARKLRISRSYVSRIEKTSSAKDFEAFSRQIAVNAANKFNVGLRLSITLLFLTDRKPGFRFPGR